MIKYYIKEVKKLKVKQVRIFSDYITLGQLLKLLNLIQTGGMAKLFLQEHHVLVNEEKEVRRGRKLYVGDRVIIDGYGEYMIT